MNLFLRFFIESRCVRETELSTTGDLVRIIEFNLWFSPSSEWLEIIKVSLAIGLLREPIKLLTAQLLTVSNFRFPEQSVIEDTNWNSMAFEFVDKVDKNITLVRDFLSP